MKSVLRAVCYLAALMCFANGKARNFGDTGDYLNERSDEERYLDKIGEKWKGDTRKNKENHVWKAEGGEEVDYCRKICGTSGGVRCEGQNFENTVKCKCKEEGMAFKDIDSGCEEDKCFTKCGIPFDTRDELTCTGGPFGEDVKCVCSKASRPFDPDARKCRAMCKERKDCANGADCIEQETGKKFCKCPEGTSGDKCSIVDDCQPNGKLNKCTGGRNGRCKFDADEQTAKCVCPDLMELKYYDVDGYCEDICDEWKNCTGNNRICNYEVGVCVCKPGYSGENCNVLDGCTREQNRKCTKAKAQCVYFESEPYATCKCINEKYVFQDPECKHMNYVCEKNFPNCQMTGGICTLDADNQIDCKCTNFYPQYYERGGCGGPPSLICQFNFPKCEVFPSRGACTLNADGQMVCECPKDTTYVWDIGCSAVDDTCKWKFPKCEKTGGTCTVDADYQIECQCPYNSTYEIKTGCSVTDYMCGIKFPKCQETKGACTFDADGQIVCECPKDTTYCRGTGCRGETKNTLVWISSSIIVLLVLIIVCLILCLFHRKCRKN